MFNAYNSIYVNAENASYASNFVIANWSKLAKAEKDDKKKEIIINKIKEFKQLVLTSQEKAAEAEEKMEQLRSQFNFEEPQVIFTLSQWKTRERYHP